MKTKRTFLGITGSLVLLTVLFTTSCTKDKIDENNPIPITPDEKSASLIQSGNEFGLELFGKIRETGNEENLMISPLSISVALAMAYNGADGNTKTEMENVLKMNGLTAAEINNSFKTLIAALQSLDKDVTFQIANAIFYKQGWNIKNSYLTTIKSVYNAEISALDFQSPSAVNTINNWVSQKTNRKINSIINQLNPLDRMVLLNAVYFNGNWKKQFDKNGTKNRTFIKTNGSFIEVPTMSKTDSLYYCQNSLFRSVKLPYGKGQYNMIVLLPVDGKNSREVIKQLTAANWKSWMAAYELKPKVEVLMPRFKYSFDTGLPAVLKLMGMQQAFQAGVANFANITDESLYISDIKHKSFIDVNETGTEAAAVTAVTFTTTSMPVETEKILFNVNKPFVYAITEKSTNAILFIGEVNHPEYNL